MILLPTVKSIAAAVSIHAEVHGRYRCSAGKNLGYIDGNTGIWIPGREVVTKEIDFFENVITDQGMNYIGQSIGFFSHCHVGTGTATEQETDTALASFVAAQAVDNNVANTYRAVQGSSPYYGKSIRHFRFDEGAAEGNIAEVGVGKQAATGGLFSRARVKDGGGSPTTITVLSDEFLDVDYEYRVYPAYDTADLDSIVSGEDFLLRAAKVTTYDNMASGLNSGANKHFVGTNVAVAYSDDATLGTVTQGPSATSNDPTINATKTTYVDDNHYADINYHWELDDAVFGAGNGIKAIIFYTTMGSYQLLFDNEQAKDNTEVADLDVRLSWSRATI